MNSLKYIVLLFGYVLLVNGQYIGRTRQPPLPERCSRIFCPQPDCLNPVRPVGECCPVCRPTLPPICAAVSCVVPDCVNPVTPEGQCCPVCPSLPPICDRVRCARPNCLTPVIPDGECCPVCRGTKPGRCPRPGPFGICVNECTNDFSCPGNQKCCSNGCGRQCRQPIGRCVEVQCPLLRCANQYTPPGECCPVCRPIGPDCRNIACPARFCDGQYTPVGQCCPVCPDNSY